MASAKTMDPAYKIVVLRNGGGDEFWMYVFGIFWRFLP